MLQGSPIVTFDVDICYDRTDDNLVRLVAALQELNAKLRGVGEDVPFRLDPQSIKNGDHFTFTTNAGSLDCLGTPSGSSGFNGLIKNAKMLEIDGVEVFVAAVEDVIRMKRAAGRPKDLQALPELIALRDEMERGG